MVVDFSGQDSHSIISKKRIKKIKQPFAQLNCNRTFAAL
jgi:hypothetical protein